MVWVSVAWMRASILLTSFCTVAEIASGEPYVRTKNVGSSPNPPAVWKNLQQRCRAGAGVPPECDGKDPTALPTCHSLGRGRARRAVHGRDRSRCPCCAACPECG